MPFGASFAATRALAGLVQLLQACAPQAVKHLPEEQWTKEPRLCILLLWNKTNIPVSVEEYLHFYG